jgi:tetratricopeptide (TPR) repeat protein
MRRTSWAVAAVIALCASGLGAGPLSERAAAQDDDDSGARRAFRLGQAHYENGEFEEAAAQFEEAYRLSHRGRLMYNAYLAYRDMQDLPNSARALRTFLAETTDLPSNERDQLQARLAAIERALASQSAAPPDTSTSQGETGMGGTGGTGTGDSGTGDTGAGTGDTGTGSSTGSGDTSPGPSSGGGGGFNPSPVGFIVGGVGAALIITGIIVGALSGDDLAMLQDACAPDGLCPDTQALRDAQSRGSSMALAGDVLWITGVVALAAGITLIFVLQDDSSDSASAGMACSPEGCFGTVQGRF